MLVDEDEQGQQGQEQQPAQHPSQGPHLRLGEALVLSMAATWLVNTPSDASCPWRTCRQQDQPLSAQHPSTVPANLRQAWGHRTSQAAEGREGQRGLCQQLQEGGGGSAQSEARAVLGALEWMAWELWGSVIPNLHFPQITFWGPQDLSVSTQTRVTSPVGILQSAWPPWATLPYSDS